MGFCKRCKRTWSALNECHCAGCCNHFSGVFAFDKHRVGKGATKGCMTIEQMLNKKMVYDNESKRWVSGSQPEGRFFAS